MSSSGTPTEAGIHKSKIYNCSVMLNPLLNLVQYYFNIYLFQSRRGELVHPEKMIEVSIMQKLIKKYDNGRSDIPV